MVSTKKETAATLIDTSGDPMEWDTMTTEIAAGIQNNGVRWVPSPEALQKVLN